MTKWIRQLVSMAHFALTVRGYRFPIATMVILAMLTAVVGPLVIIVFVIPLAIVGPNNRSNK